MSKVRVVVKGTIAATAAAAATHGLKICDGYTQFGGRVVGDVEATGAGTSFLFDRVVRWYVEGKADPPFPPGTLLSHGTLE